MKLLRLLSLGKSFIGLKNGPGRYRMTDLNLLPKFTALDSPWEDSVEVKAEPRRRVARWWQRLWTALWPGKIKAAEPTDSLALPGKPANTLTSRIFGHRRRPLVQPELALEKVQVMANDLTDSDLELVDRQGRKPKPSTKKGQESAEAGGAKWGKPEIRIFKPEEQSEQKSSHDFIQT